MCDAEGRRLAKRHDALSLQSLRGQGVTPAEILRKFSPATCKPPSAS
jgi:glutamyl-tRNA synthetase